MMGLAADTASPELKGAGMSLLGTPLLVIVAFLALALPLSTMVLWSRVKGPRVVRGGTRLSLLLSGQVATVLLVVLLANDYGQFYTSWNDLFGNSGGPPTVATFGANTPAVSNRQQLISDHGPTTGRLTVLGQTNWASQAQRSTRGAVESVSLTGLTSGLTVNGYVYLPPEYFAPKNAHRRFPAVEVLTGYPGSALSLFSRLDYPAVALQLVKENHSAPMIYVMLSPTVAPPRDTECTDIPGGPQAETFMAQELPSAVESALRVQPGNWGIAGDSTGGYCATKITMSYRQTFAADVSLSGYYFARSDRTTGNLWGGSLAVKHANDPEWLLTHKPAPPVSLYVTTSRTEDRFDGYPDTMKFLHDVKAPMNVTALIRPSGGHNLTTWEAELPQALQWLSNRLASPRT